jgi:hypothetical protein
MDNNGDETNERSCGYISILLKKSLWSDRWQRRFLAVNGSRFSYYIDKRTYELSQDNSQNARPIDLDGYTLIAGALEPPYAITLTPIDIEDSRAAWKFRCDTLPEFHFWVKLFSAALKLCSNENSKADLMVITKTTKVAGRGRGEEGDDTRSVVESVKYE